MAALGYLEELDTAGRVCRRVPVHALPFSIGRGYASDLLLDDPHVAARHATLEYDHEAGWRLVDAGTRNRLRVGDEICASAILAGATIVMLGHTRLRFFPAQSPVAEEMPVPAIAPRSRRWPPPERLQRWPIVVLAAGLLALLEGVRTYFAAGAEQLDWAAAQAAIEILGIALGWSSGWSLLSRLFAGQARFRLHLLIGLSALLALMIAAALVYLGAFAFDFAAGAALTSGLAAAVLGGAVWLHLGAITSAHRRVCAIGSIGLAVALITLDGARQYSDTGIVFPPVDRLELLPPGLRLRSPATLDEFLDDARELRRAIDASAS